MKQGHRTFGIIAIVASFVLGIILWKYYCSTEISYETFDLKIPDELKDQVTEGCQVVYWDVLGEKVMKQLKMAAE